MMNHQPSQETRLTWFYTLALCVLVVIYKVLPRYLYEPSGYLLWNLVPMGALALFVGSRLRTSWAFLVPLHAMVVSDLLLIPAVAALGLSSFTLGTPLLYLSFALYVGMGRWIRQNELSPTSIVGTALLASGQFFLISNFASWLDLPEMYSRTLDGLMHCYINAVPFYRNTLLSDLVFPLVFFGLHAALLRGFGLTKERQPA